MANAVLINGQNLPVREYEGVRVVTLNDVATVHQTEAKRIRDNFNNNRKHFTEGTDYFLIKGKKANLN
ncbi:MAG: ORF6N domain-containing protein [Methanolobus sp.]|nr:ORF6N domain-containing protein [Methanolobus sp.]